MPGLGASQAPPGPSIAYDTIIAIVAGRVPELVGLAEVAELLSKSRRQAIRWTSRPGFPEPVAKLRATPVWRKADVERWARAAPLRRRSRPR